MKTTQDAVKQLNEVLKQNNLAQGIIDDLIAPHDYQDVASLLTQTTSMLVQAALALMEEKDDTTALQLVENAEDLLDTMYGIIEGDLDL